MSYHLLIEPPTEGITENELMHHGIKGMKWGIRRFQPYSQVPRGSGKTGKFVGKKSPIVVDRDYSGNGSYSKGPINRYNLPQQRTSGSLHKKLYDTDEEYRKNYDDAEPLRKAYRDAVEKETNLEQKILNGDFGLTDEKTGKNPKSLDNAWSELDRLSNESLAKYSSLQDHYEQITDHLIQRVSEDKSLRHPPTIKDEADAAGLKDYQNDFGKKYKGESPVDVFKRMDQIYYVRNPRGLERVDIAQKIREKQKDDFRETIKDMPVDDKFKAAITKLEKADEKYWNAHDSRPYDEKAHTKASEEYNKAYSQVTREMLRTMGVTKINDSDFDRINQNHYANWVLEQYWGGPKRPGRKQYGVAHADDSSENELYHHGVKGMKWGIRRYQPYSTVPRESGKTGKFIGDAAKKVRETAGGVVQKTKATGSAVKTAASNASKAHAEKKAARAEARETKRKEAYEAAKKKAVESGDINELAKYKKDLSHEEITKALLRISDEQKIDDAVQKSKESGAWEAADKLMKRVNQLSGYIGTASNLYQNMANLKKNRKSLQDFNQSVYDEENEKARKAKVDKMIKKQDWDSLSKFARKEGLEQGEYQRILNAAENQKKLDAYTSKGKAKEAERNRKINTAMSLEDLEKMAGDMTPESSYYYTNSNNSNKNNK